MPDTEQQKLEGHSRLNREVLLINPVNQPHFSVLMAYSSSVYRAVECERGTLHVDTRYQPGIPVERIKAPVASNDL